MSARLRVPALASLLALVCSSACKTKEERPSSTTAASSSSAPASKMTPPPALALDDLLHFTDARIGVSSKVDNPRDFAEHVADGKLDTAWNGKTGDLVGGWIGFRVPKETRVRIVELTAGYVARSKKGEDLFAMNHRISRVRVVRDGVALGEFPLDPNVRDFQRIMLDAPGGDFKLEVLAVTPGTRTAWRELVVSEIRVLGIAGAAKRPVVSNPRVQVGGFDAPAPAPAARFTKREETASLPVSTIPVREALCEQWLSPLRKEHEELESGKVPLPDTMPWAPPAPTCSDEVRSAGDRGVELLLLSRSDLRESFREPLIRRGPNSYIVGYRFDGRSHFDPGCSGSEGGKLVSARLEGDVAIFVVYEWSLVNPWPEVLADGTMGEGSPGSSHLVQNEVRCALGAVGTTPSCTKKMLAEKSGRYDPSVMDAPPPLPWK